MSVINQMLRDLDTRAADEQERSGLPPRLRPLPPAAQLDRQPWRMLALGLVAGAVLAGSVAFLLRPEVLPRGPATIPAPVAPTASALVAAVAPADIGEMKISTLLSLAQPPQADGAPPTAPAMMQQAKPVAAKPTVSQLAAAPIETGAKQTPKVASETSPPASAPIQKSANPPKTPPAVEEQADNAHIDKRAKGGQGRELAEGEYRKGMQAVKRGDNAAARPQFQRALEFDPGMAKARQALLSVLVGARQWAEAQKFAQSGLDLDPAQTGWAMILARLQFEQGDASGALLTLEKHAAHAQADADYHGLFAYLLQKQQRPAEAAEHFKLAVSLRPNEGRWWFGLGLALEGAGRAGEAKEAFQKARTAGNLSADMSAVIEQKLK